MSADEYRSALDTLGFSQQRLATAVGASPRTGQKWALGETRVPGAVALLLRLLLARPELVALITASTPMRTRTRVPAKRKKRVA
jgi:DNA-binding transcriptional regulator YiaG